MPTAAASRVDLWSSFLLSSSWVLVKGPSGNLLWKWGAEKIPAGEAINAKLSGDSGRFSNEDSGDFIKLQPA
ncbi:MAG: hypothetical protein ACI8TX_002968 [Hyphomicrobiaceae bacterium]|jgi:hypothetical protein